MSFKDKLGVSVPGPSDPLGLIPPERLAELREEARIKAKAKLQKKQEDAFLAKETERFERELDPRPEYEMRSIVIDAADHTDVIRIDNQYFFYGQKYDVPKPIYDQLNEILQRGWAHEREISVPTRRVMSNNRGVVLHGADNSGNGARF